MTRYAPIAILALAAVACGEPARSDLPTAFQDTAEFDPAAKRDIGQVRWRLWEKAVDIAPDEPISSALDYGQCVTVEPATPDVDVQIECGNPWSDVAWYRVPAEVVEAALADGRSVLVAKFGLSDAKTERSRVRVSVQEMLEDGGRKKLGTADQIFDGEHLAVPLSNAADHSLYVAHGRVTSGLWNASRLEFTLYLSFEAPSFEAPSFEELASPTEP